MTGNVRNGNVELEMSEMEMQNWKSQKWKCRTGNVEIQGHGCPSNNFLGEKMDF